MDWRKRLGRGGEPVNRLPDRLLTVRVDGREVASVRLDDVPCEATSDVSLAGPAAVDFEDAAGTVHRHRIPAERGWLRLSVRVHPTLGCQADAVVTARPEHQAGALLGEGEVGVRFQPFFLAGAPNPPALMGSGLFARGLLRAGHARQRPAVVRV